MSVKSGLAEKNEYNVSVENADVTLLINKSRNSPVSNIFEDISHTHLYNELFVCLADEINIQLEQDIIHLCKNDAALIPANISHYNINAEPFENWQSVGFSVVKKAKNSNNLYGKLSSLFIDNKPKTFKSVPEICKKVAELHNVPYETNDYLPALELVCILSKLSVAKMQSETLTAQPQMRTQDIYRIAYLEDIIQNRFYEPLTTGKLAEALNLSSRQLSRIIKATYGKTFHELLTETRLNFATNLLITTNHPINTILSETGYARSSLFYKDFADKFNMTPTEYRKKFGIAKKE